MSEVEKYLDLCETALEDFEKGKEAGQSYRALYNRLYYACFYAAKAALLSKDIEAGTHAGIADRVFLELYQERNLLEKEVAAVLSRVQTKRDQSDYELEISESEEELDEIEKDSRKFVNRMRGIVEDENNG